MVTASAADVPVKAKPVEYVKICSLYGTGFYYIPGTVLKIGGYARFQTEANAGSSGQVIGTRVMLGSGRFDNEVQQIGHIMSHALSVGCISNIAFRHTSP